MRTSSESPTVDPSLISKIAADLMTPSVLRTDSQNISKGSSRVLCLILQPSIGGQMHRALLPDEGKRKGRTIPLGTKPRTKSAVAEAFLRFSPRVQFREPNLVFIDIASTSHFFKNQSTDPSSPERGVLEAALQLASELGYEAKGAISDTAAAAQAFAHLQISGASHFKPICHPGEERESLQPLSLPLLLQLEGLTPWANPRAIEQIVTFFYMLGFEKIGELERFSLTSFQDRWGETGALLWKRIHGLDRQPISPLLPTEPLEEYVHLDFPISLASLLLHQVRRSLTFLLARLQGRCLFASRLVVRLHCEYSNTRHKIEIEPNTPCRDLNLLLTLLENKLEGVDLENPIRDFEIEVVPVPERTHQLDFFEPRTTDQDKLESLFSLLHQSAVRTGRYEIQDAILPERSWDVKRAVQSPVADYEDEYETEGAAARAQTMPAKRKAKSRQRAKQTAKPVGMASSAARVASSIARASTTTTEGAYQSLPEYGVSVMNAPRPTRLLKTPRRLPIDELQKLHMLTGHPIERLEEAWWEGGGKRDYYFAVSPQGQCLWIFQDLDSQEYYLHGYFD